MSVCGRISAWSCNNNLKRLYWLRALLFLFFYQHNVDNLRATWDGCPTKKAQRSWSSERREAVQPAVCVVPLGVNIQTHVQNHQSEQTAPLLRVGEALGLCIHLWPLPAGGQGVRSRRAFGGSIKRAIQKVFGRSVSQPEEVLERAAKTEHPEHDACLLHHNVRLSVERSLECMLLIAWSTPLNKRKRR